MDNLQNKTAMIIGGAGGLGTEFVKILLENGAKNIAIMDLPTSQNRAEEIELEGKYGKGRTVFFPCDVTKAKEFETTFRKVLDAFGRLDILVNSAGIVSENHLEQAIEVNLSSVIRSSLLALDHMGKHKGGKGGVIVNVASIFGLSSQNCGVPIYCATKHGVVGFSHCLANFYYMSEVRVLVLCPNVTLTPMITEFRDDQLLDFVDNKVFNLDNMPKQTAENVSRALLHLVREAENGLTWVSEGGQPPYVVNFSHYSEQAPSKAK